MNSIARLPLNDTEAALWAAERALPAIIAREQAEAVVAYEERLGRPLTALERASVEHTAMDTVRRETMHQLWLDGLTDFERRVMLMPPRSV